MQNKHLGRAARLAATLLTFALVLSGCDMFGGTPTVTIKNPTPVNTPVTGSTAPTDSSTATSPANPPTDTATSPANPPTDTAIPPTATPIPTKVSVTVNNAWDGTPVANASIAVQQSGGPIAATTDAQGQYSFDNLATDATATISADGYVQATLSKFNPGPNTVSLMPNTIHGHVIDATTGKPLVNVMVRAYPGDASTAPTTPMTATATMTSSYDYGSRPLAAPLMLTDTTPTTNTTPSYVRVYGTDTDGLWMADAPHRGATHIRLLPEGTTLRVTGANQQADNLTWVPVQTTDDRADKGWVVNLYLIPSAAPVPPPSPRRRRPPPPRRPPRRRLPPCCNSRLPPAT